MPSAEPPRRVVILDDEVGPARYAQLPEDLRDVLGDTNSPEFEEIWSFGERQRILPSQSGLSLDVIQRHVESDEFVNDVVLADAFYQEAGPQVRARLEHIRDRRAKIQALLRAVSEAFPSPTFEVTSMSSRPIDAADLLVYDLLILDLVMQDTDPVASVSKYLQALSDAAGDTRQIPPIVLISHRADDLDKSRLTFRTSAQISAAGLSILAKQTVADAAFGGTGLRLLWDEMNAQKDVAHRIRILCRAWNRALRVALEATEETLWNLDAAALQQIHLTAAKDNDPFEEHLHELIAREHIWHVEKDDPVRSAVAALGNRFIAHISGEGDSQKITFRYTAHASADMGAMRRLVRHYAWNPTHSLGNLTAFSEEKDAAEFNRYIPFGVVLAPYDFGKRTEVLIHLTQQCDLNKRTPFRRELSLIFVRARAVEVNRVQKEPREPGSMVVQGLVFEDKDFDLHVSAFRPIAIPVDRFMRYAKRKLWRVAARIRQDIARQILQFVVNNATRVAAFTPTPGQYLTARVCLRIGSKTGTKEAWYGESDVFADARDIVVSRFDDKTLHFLDDQNFRIALWVKKQLVAAGADALVPDLRELCSQLRLGLQITEVLVGNLKCSALSGDPTKAQEAVATISARAGKAALVVFASDPTPT